MSYLGNTFNGKTKCQHNLYVYMYIYTYSYTNKNKDLEMGQIGCTIESWHILYSYTVLLHTLNEARNLLQAVPRRLVFFLRYWLESQRKFKTVKIANR